MQLVQRDTVLSQPHNVIQALSNMFPFLDTPRVTTAVKAVCALAQRPDSTLDVDMGTLEQIMASAARKGEYELGLAVWDLMEILHKEPTVAMYEGMVQAFCMAYRQDQSVFSCLVEMEDHGHVPSRALIRSISRSLRFSVSRIDNAYRYIVHHQHGCRPTQASLNSIMSGCAELGDVDRTFSVLLDDFTAHSSSPNSDSYSFAMESLAISTCGRATLGEEPISEEVRTTRLDMAEWLLNMMEEQNIAIDSHVFHEYMRVLINCGQIRKATTAALDACGSGRAVQDKTLIILINHEEDLEVARQLAEHTSEPFDFIQRRLAKWEQEGKSSGSHYDSHAYE